LLGIWVGSRWPRRLLALIWVVYGGLLLGLPLVLPGSLPPEGGSGREVVRWLLVPISFVLGAALSCVWFGWYLAVALAFNGHNNEAGGAARIDGFKGLVRFRLTREGLTGFVI